MVQEKDDHGMKERSVRLWSLHPQHLDAKGLVACWREALLAQKVLAGGTVGYRNHPQLVRFWEQQSPLVAIGAYLTGVHDQATDRGYRFNPELIQRPVSDWSTVAPITVSDGQVDYEWNHLGAKLAARSSADYRRWQTESAEVHPVFRVVLGEVADWEKM